MSILTFWNPLFLQKLFNFNKPQTLKLTNIQNITNSYSFCLRSSNNFHDSSNTQNFDISNFYFKRNPFRNFHTQIPSTISQGIEKSPKITFIGKEIQRSARLFDRNKFQALKIHNSSNKHFSTLNQFNKKANKTNPQSFSRQDLIDGLKNKTFKKIIFLTGAGISVSAGIPDFRSPKTGLYQNLSSYNLPYPEAVFEIDYFKTKPKAFYRLIKELSHYNAKPTITHQFMKALADEGFLYMNFTQNIDGLEIKAGLDPKYMVEAHGHTRSAHCIECGKEASVEEFMKNVEYQTIYKCQCSGLIKPDIIFFGELLPKIFFENLKKITEGDLVIVMGTSLQVFPFASLVSGISENVPLVYINRENTNINRENFLFIEGDIDEQMNTLINEIGWKEKFCDNE